MTFHSKLRATVKSREVPAEVIDEVNAFLEELRMSEAVFYGDEHNDEERDEQQAEEEQNQGDLDDELDDEEEIDILF